MATGAEHYREAERLMAEAGDYNASDGAPVALIQRAQLHAALALAAAMNPALDDQGGED